MQISTNQISSNHPIVIYGAGNCGRSTLRLLQERGYDVRGFLDRHVGLQSPGGVLGLPCLHPDGEGAQHWKSEGAILVVGVWNPEVDLSLLGSQLELQNWARVVLFPEICDLWGAPIEPFWASSRTFYEDSEVKSEIAATGKLWADESSRRLFDSSIEARRTLKLESLNQAAREQNGVQYFPADIPAWPVPKRFVDCGAYDGDTLRVLPPGVEMAAAFEPDVQNFQTLARLARGENGGLSCPVLLWPCGVWRESGQLSFAGGTGSSSHLSDEGEEKISVVALDDAIPNFAPDMIKMDIEGAEDAALKGAARLILKHQPALAIAVYHRPEHLWGIALWLHREYACYRFYLRIHALNGFETILYAVPK